MQVAWLTFITQIPVPPSVSPVPNLPLQIKMCQCVGGSGKLSGRAAGVRAGVTLPSSFPVQLAASVPHAAPIAASFLSPCLWLGVPLLALLLSGDGWRLRAVLVESLQPRQLQDQQRAGSGRTRPLQLVSSMVISGCAEPPQSQAFGSTIASLAVSCAHLPACVRHMEAGKALYSPVCECRDLLRQHRVEEQYCSHVKQAYKENAFTSALLVP